MANFLYNGVELPDIEGAYSFLAEVEGITTEDVKKILPYAFIGKHKTTAEYVLLLNSSQMYADEEIAYSPAETVRATFDVYEGAWRLMGVGELSTPTATIGKDYAIWTSHDILNTDGTLYLAASDPVPVGGKFTLHYPSFLKGVEVGRRLKNKRLRKPVAYLYATRQCPPLPDRDEKTHPHAIMLFYSNPLQGTRTTVLYLMQDINTRKVYDVNGITREAIGYKAGDIEYSVTYKTGEAVSDWGEPIEKTETKYFELRNIRWTNSDIVLAFDTYDGTAGTLYLAASEPIPVYE